MKRLWAIVTLVLLAVWLPATNHCLLEDLGWIHHDACCESSADNPGGDHDAADGFCRTETGGVAIPKAGLVFGQFNFTAVGISGQILPPLRSNPPSSLPEIGVSPPGLKVRWQFDHRAALAARAPSFAS